MKIESIDFVILALSSFGLTYLIRYTDGPWNIFKEFRILVGVLVPIYDENRIIVDHIDDPSDRFISQLIGCFWCFNTWISLAFTILYFTFPEIFPVFVWLAMISVAGVINTFIGV